MVPDDGHIRCLDWRLVDNLTITHHHNTVRKGQEFVQVLTYQQNSRPLIAHRHDLRADFSGRCNVETKAGIRHQQYLHGVAQFAREHCALDVASREGGDRRLGRWRSNAIACDEILGHTGHGGKLQPPATARQRWAVETAKYEIFGHTHAWHTGIAERFLRETTDTVLGHLLAGGPIRVSTYLNRTGHWRALPGEDFDELPLPVPRDSGNADDFAGMQREVDVTQRQNASIIQGLQATYGQTLRPWRYLCPRHGRRHVPRPYHHFGHRCRGQRAYRASAHELAAPQDRHGVRKRLHLTQLVGNHQHGHTALACHRVQQPQHFIGFPWGEH